ncbi:MAG: NosD domain-containing protein, partial [Candidatus Omnitrophota bacterium]|nr:NosD domain-containing protein [Candidatus Omnitrophota bacterium]
INYSGNPRNPNIYPADSDGDGIPDLKEKYDDGDAADIDNDGVPDISDLFPTDPTNALDTDLDGIGDNTDSDDDNDGYSDAEELLEGTNPLGALSVPKAAKDLAFLIDIYADDVFVLSHQDVQEADPLKTHRVVTVLYEGHDYKLEYNAYGDIIKLTCPDGRIFKITNTYDATPKLISSIVASVKENYSVTATFATVSNSRIIYDTFSGNGSIYAIRGSSIVQLNNAGGILKTLTGFASPTLMALDETRGAKGTLWVVAGTNLIKIDVASDTRTTYAIAATPDQIIIDKPEGSVWLINKSSHAIQKLDQNGNDLLVSAVDIYGIETFGAMDVETGYNYSMAGTAAIDASGYLYYTEYFSETAYDPLKPETYEPKFYLTKVDKDGIVIDRAELMAIVDANGDSAEAPTNSLIDIEGRNVWVVRGNALDAGKGLYNIDFSGYDISSITIAALGFTPQVLIPDTIYDGVWISSNNKIVRYNANCVLLDEVASISANALINDISTGDIFALDSTQAIKRIGLYAAEATPIIIVMCVYDGDTLTGFTATDLRTGAAKKYNTREYNAEGRLMAETNIAGVRTVFVGYAHKGYETIQEAIDRASTGNIVKICAGDYELTDTIDLKAGVKLEGDGRHLVTIIGPAPQEVGGVIICKNTINAQSGTTIKGITIVNRSTGAGTAANSAICLNGVTGVTIEEVIIDSGSYGISLANSSLVTIKNSLIKNTLLTGISLATITSSAVIDNNTFAANINAISLIV